MIPRWEREHPDWAEEYRVMVKERDESYARYPDASRYNQKRTHLITCPTCGTNHLWTEEEYNAVVE